VTVITGVLGDMGLGGCGSATWGVKHLGVAVVGQFCGCRLGAGTVGRITSGMLGRKRARCSHAVCSACCFSLLTPGWRISAARVVASGVKTVVSWLSLQGGSVHVPQNRRQQHMLSGTPVSRMSA